MAEKSTILIVDDELSVRRAVRRELRHEGAEILLAESGMEALQMLQEHSIDIVISDLRMPGMSGISLLSSISERWPDIARILLTGNADFPDIVKAVNEGNISYFLEKPWSREQLLLIVRQFLQQSALRRSQETLSSELAEKNEALAGEIDVKNRLMAIMSHEIRTPLNGIHGVLQLLADGSKDPREMDELVKVGLSSSEDLRKIVDDVLDYFRLGTDHIAVEAQPFSPALVIQDVVKLMGPAAAEKSLLLEFFDSKTLPDSVIGDAPHFRRLLANLLSNAVRYTDAGSVTVDCSASADDEIVVTVTDTGKGIPADKLPLVFEEFRLVDDSHARETGGTGLGLAICRRLVEHMGGTLNVSSVVGEGSCFTLKLPVDRCGEVAVDEPPDSSVDRIECRVAIVDDHAVNLSLLEIMLERLGCEVIAYDSANAVLADFRRTQFVRPDILLTDISMPGMDGIELTRTLRAEELVTPDFPIVALTAHNMAHEVEGFLAAGMTGHIAKPLQKEELRRVLVDMVESPQQADRNAAIENLLAEVGDEAMPVLVQAFLRDTRSRSGFILRALEANDDATLMRECHTLASSAAQFGASELATLCRDVESFLKSGNAAMAAERAGGIDGVAASSIKRIETWLASCN